MSSLLVDRQSIFSLPKSPAADILPPMSKNHPIAYVVEDEMFRFVLEMEVRKALRIQHPVSVLTIMALPTSKESGRLADADPIVASVSRVIRGADLIGLVPTGPALRVLLVGAHLSDTDGVMERIREEVSRESTMRFGVACFPATDRTAEELLGRADAEVGLATR